MDFHKAEQVALSKTFRDFGIDPTQYVLDRYHVINKWHWEQLELGKMTRAEVQTGRFQMLFDELGVAGDPSSVTAKYMENLSIGHYFLPGAEETVELLSKKYRLFLASNGTASVQKGRMTSANLYRFFEKVFVSQELGANKPAKEFFDRATDQIPDFDPAKALMVGDSLSSDIKGGINAGIRTCWVNPNHAAGNSQIVPDYEIEALSDLPSLLETL